jgi:hypothetical protein
MIAYCKLCAIALQSDSAPDIEAISSQKMLIVAAIPFKLSLAILRWFTAKKRLIIWPMLDSSG